MIEPPPKIEQKNFSKALKMLKDKDCLSKVRAINDKYYYWDKVKYQDINCAYSPIDLWAAVKLSRQVDYKSLKFGIYTFSFTQTDFIQRILHEFDLHIGGNLGAEKLIPDEDKDKYLVSSIMEEAIASSQIEGAVTTRKQAKEMLRKNDRPRSKSEQMILNNYRTIQHIVDRKNEMLTPENLLEIHRLITFKTLDEKQDEGAYRDTNDIFVVDHVHSEVVHIPPDFKDVHGLMEQVCDFFNDDNHEFFMHPVLKGIIIHFLTGFIHPFTDGNGRTARALFYWYLLSKGYWLTEYLSISRLIIKSKNQYEKAYLYTENDENDLTYFLNYNLRTMELAYEELRRYIQRKIEEKRYITQFQRIPNINKRQAEILRMYVDEANLILTVKELETRFMVSNQTARSDLLQLVKDGFIEIIQANKKKQIFIRTDKFEKLVKEKLTHTPT